MTAPAITEAEIRMFRDEGYCICPHFFSEREAEAMQRTVQAFKREGFLHDQSVADSAQNYQMHFLSEVSTLWRALPWEERVMDAVTRLLDTPNIEVHLDQMFLKPPHKGLGTAFHQDNGYFGISDPLKGTGMWIAVDPATEENGTMRIVPKTHLEPTLKHRRDSVVEQLITCVDEIDESAAVPCVLEPGGVVFFCYGAVHGTGVNLSGHERSGVAYHFVSSDHVQNQAKDGTEQHRQLTGVSRGGWVADGGRREYGEPMEGKWHAAVDEILRGPPDQPTDAELGRLMPREFFVQMQDNYRTRNAVSGRAPSSSL